MIPELEILTSDIEEVEYPTETYKIEVRINYEEDRIKGHTDDLDAIQQAIYLILNTERYAFPIYSWVYGIELIDLIGKPMPYVMSELPRRVKEALIQDDRITDVKDFTFEKNKSKLHTTFTVITKSGDITSELEVTI